MEEKNHFIQGIFMNKILLSLVLLSSALISGCNTVGGLGRDISETGAALDKAAGWSQTQINGASEWANEATTSEPAAY